jgi:hypothetical protein
VNAPDAVARLRSIVDQMLNAGKDKSIVLNDLKMLRDELRSEANEISEDAVLEVEDFLVGWCSPHMRLPKPPQ